MVGDGRAGAGGQVGEERSTRLSTSGKVIV